MRARSGQKEIALFDFDCFLPLSGEKHRTFRHKLERPVGLIKIPCLACIKKRFPIPGKEQYSRIEKCYPVAGKQKLFAVQTAVEICS